MENVRTNLCTLSAILAISFLVTVCAETPVTNSTEILENLQCERTLIMVKPDGVQRGLVGTIIERFEKKGFKLVGLKFVWASEELLRKHYSDMVSKTFFPSLIKYVSSGPVVPMVWEGLNAVKTGRQMLGARKPVNSLPGTIRGDFSIHVGRSIIHGSDSVESAIKEIGLWFTEKEIVGWTPALHNWIYEEVNTTCSSTNHDSRAT